MTKFDLRSTIRSVQKALTRHSAAILTGTGIAGMITTTVLAVRATPKALALLEERKNREKTDRLTALETVKTAGRCYIPAVLTGALSVACLISGSSVQERRNAALATAYSLSETALKEYRDKVVEVVGETKERSIRDEVAKERLQRQPEGNREIIVTDRGNTLCFDNLSGRYFYSDIEKLRKAENDINRRLRDEMTISLNEFYEEIGLPSIGVGDDIGWSIDKEYLEIFFSAQLTQDGRTPCLTMNYDVSPEYNYR